MIEFKKSATHRPIDVRGYLITWCYGVPDGDAWLDLEYIRLGRNDFVAAVKASQEEFEAMLDRLNWWNVWRTV